MAKSLQPPSENAAVLSAIPETEIRAGAPKFDLKSADGTVVQIFSSGSWIEPAFGVFLDRTPKGAFTVTTVTYDLDLLPKPPSPAERRKLEKSTAEFETALALRFIALLKKELSKAARNEGKLPAVDTVSYQYWYKTGERKLLSGETTSMVPDNSRLGRLNRISYRLRELALSSDSERLEILNAIDRSISEVELSYDLQ